MSDKSDKPVKRSKNGIRHQLLVYHFVAHRYRPVGILLFVMGLLLLLPTYISQLRFHIIFTYQQLAYIGLASIVCGAGLWILSIFMEKQAYVRCKPNFLLIHLPFRSIKIPYGMINSIQSVSVGRVFDIKSMKGRDRGFIKPLQNENAVEVEMTQYPMDEKKLKRGLSPLLFTPRTQGFIFIVPSPSQLSIEINRFQQEALDQRDEAQTRYLDPIDRLKYQSNNK